MKFYIPFRYKLTAIIAMIIVVLLMVIFTVVQRDIEQKFRVEIEKRLEQAKGYVSQRMDDRYDLLFNDATAIADDKLIRDIITDETLSTLTRNDIVSEGVLPKFANLDILSITNADGVLLAQQQQNEQVTSALAASEWYEYSMEGEAVAGYILHENTFFQGIAMPVFLGEEMIGIVVAGRMLTQQDIAQIKQISEIDIAVLNDNVRVTATPFSGISDSSELLAAFDQWLVQTDKTQLIAGQTVEVNLGKERFLLKLAIDETLFVPPYIIARSLDDELMFVENIRDTMQGLGSVGIVFGVVIGFLFAVGVSSPIKRLSIATTQVANENFSHRVHISSKDEFAKLGESFNQMIIDLGEKQKIRSAFDKSVSKEVADHMLNQGVELGGTTEHATIMFADIRGFTSLSEELDEKSLINLLNQYFSQVNKCIIDQKGVIDKFIGDAVMALFGTPLPCDDSGYHGLIAGRKMLETVAVFNRQNKLVYGCEIEIGIGLNTGTVVAGMVGSDDRLNFTVLGDQVNIASRIEGLCKTYGCAFVLSESTVNDIKKSRALWEETIDFRLLDCVQVKGKTKGLKIYQPFFSAEQSVLDCINFYERAVQQMFDRQLLQAQDTLTELTLLWPNDMPTAKLFQSCQNYLSDPLSYDKEYANGVRIMTSK